MKLTKIFAGMAAAAIATTAMATTAFAADSTAYNYLFIATDIPCEYNDNDEALVNGQVVTCKDLKVKIGSQEFNVSAAPGKSDSNKLCFQIINKWNSKFTPEITDYTVAGAGEYITIDFTIEGLGDTTGNAGVSFQADGTWNFRNPDDGEKDKFAQPAYFPNKCVGIAGGAGGFDTNVDCQDTAINGDGSYTISIAQSGTVNAEAQKFDDGSTNEGWIWASNAVPVAPATSNTDSNSKKDDSKTDSKSDGKTDSKTDSKANSTAATTSSKAGTTNANNTNKPASSTAASDNTAATGATAGIALAGIALAGAAIVVSKRK
ncbi:NPXTG-anchored protein [uncultured Ruminococcus sp.]|uniref:NPXTG-anchored protein n=1 Tax=uncultured Ruminococcus sp. TaxID=165186 RepID=UPI0026053DB9|nr:NPXTG-anchored protein [uncultured Ruminococcus sp.]